ncbi:ABC transporter permease, partial [Erysipelothrix rhusiopathiae]|nr:ABC transporter permease [Erysipelothrix rhusiopathiae]
MGRVWRHIKDGITGVTRHFALSLSSISSVTVTLLLMSIFLFLSVNISTITRSMEQSVQIHAQISNDFEEKSQINEIQKQI